MNYRQHIHNQAIDDAMLRLPSCTSSNGVKEALKWTLNLFFVDLALTLKK